MSKTKTKKSAKKVVKKKNISKKEDNKNNFQTTWKLNELFGYSSYQDEKILKDVKKGIAEVKKFSKKYSKDKSWLTDDKVLLKALDEYFKPSPARGAVYYLYLLEDTNLENTEIKGLLQKYSDDLDKAGEASMFFLLELEKVDKPTQKKFLKSKVLKTYHYFLEELFANAKYSLTELEEKILSRTSTTRSTMWSSSLAKELGNESIYYKGAELSLGEVGNIISGSTSATTRRKLHKLYIEKLESKAMLGEPVLNAYAKNRQVSDELRGFKKSYESTVKGYGNTAKEFEDLVEIVSANNKISRDYYKLTKDILGLESLTYADRSASIGKVKKKFDFDSSIDILGGILDEFNTGLADKFRSYFTEGRVDVFPRKGKRSGAYQVGTEVESMGNFVLLNNTGSYQDFMTLAHEFGHAFHSELTMLNQPFVYRDYSTAVAETASTFFEQLAFYAILPTLSEHDQLIALHDKLGRAVSTIFRQIAFVTFEQNYHNAVREQGYVSHQQFKQMMNEAVAGYLGKSVELTESDGAFYITLAQSHLSRPYYVYSYAYGEIISMALYERYRDNKESGHESVIKFMSTGSAMKPKDIFKQSGITVNAKLWENGLGVLKSDLSKLKRLHRKLIK